MRAAQPAEAGEFYRVRGALLYVQSSGDGRPILFLHGGMQFFDTAFAKQRDFFAKDHRVIGIDQRGHGHSPDGPWPLSYQMMADDTAEVIKRIGLGAVDVVGHSDGGNVGLLLARDHPELVRRLVVSGANLRSGVSAEEVQRRRSGSRAQLLAKLSAIEAHLPPDFRRDYEKVSPDGADHWPVLLEKSYFLWLEPTVIEVEDLRRILIPVLVMAGDHDLISIEDTLELYRGLPHAQLMIFPGTGHGTWSDRPELANFAIRRFLDDSPP
jgi:pimeloyl-ACP methyl ester carboxylesterase